MPGPQEAVVITDSGAVDDGETLSSERARQAVVAPVHSNGPAVAMVDVNGGDDTGVASVDLDATLEARALLLAQRLDLL